MGLRGEFGRVLAGGAVACPNRRPHGPGLPRLVRPCPASHHALGRLVELFDVVPAAPGHVPAAWPRVVSLPPFLPSNLRTSPSPSPAFFFLRQFSLFRHTSNAYAARPSRPGRPLVPPSPTLHGSPTCPPGPRPAASGGIVRQPALLAAESYAASCRREAPDGARDRGRAFFRRPRPAIFLQGGAAALLAGPRRAAPAAGVTPPRTRPSDIPCVGTRAVPPRPHPAARGWRRGGGRRFRPPRPAPRAGEAPARPVAAHGIPHGR